ncbi:hypothetical protein VPH35_088111 [Triticum aestivum]
MVPLCEKHKKLHAAQVKNVLTSFSQIMQSIFCKRVAHILVEANSIAATSKEHMSKGVTFQVPACNAAGGCDTRAPPQTSPTTTWVPQHKKPRLRWKLQISCDTLGKEDVKVGEDKGEREEVAEDVVGDLEVSGADDEVERVVILSQGTVAALEGLALEFDDGPSCSLFKEGTGDYEWFNMDAETAKKVMETRNQVAASPDLQQQVSVGPTFDNTPKLARQNNSKLPMQYEALVPCFDTNPELHTSSDIREPTYDASPVAFAAPLLSTVQQRLPEAEFHEPGEKTVEASSNRHSGLLKKVVKKRTAQPPDGVPKMKRNKIDRKDDALHYPDFIEIEGFHTSLQNFHASLKPRADLDSELYNKKKLKKFAFSVFMGSQLAMDHDLFDHKNCEREFRRACENNHISKSDVNKHWAVVVMNLLHKQFNVFDSVKNAMDIANIKKVASNESSFHFDLDCFVKCLLILLYLSVFFSYSCGFYAILYLENFDGIVMKHFDEVPIFYPFLQIGAYCCSS